jgi:hypothetical protein
MNIKNNVNVKYKTKNNKTDDNPVFLARKNQENTKMSSRRNLSPTATRLCIVWLSGFFDCPLVKMIRETSEMSAKTGDRIAMSMK